MKKILLAVCIIITALSFQKAAAQSVHACCSKSVTAEFAMLGKDESFKASHLSPVPFNFVPREGKMITIKTAGGTDANAYEIKAPNPTSNYLIVFHEWWGLNDYMKQASEHLFSQMQNVTVIAVDMYDGKIATNTDEATALMQGADEVRIKRIIKGAFDYAGPKAHIQTIGWCFGGGWSLQASMLAEKQGVGCVMYYGMPEKSPDKLKMLSAPVLGLFAEKDGWITRELVGNFEATMKKMNKPLTVKFFNADHAFANPSNLKHDVVATEEANRMAVEFLNKNFTK